MEKIITENVKIESTMLGIEDHGIFTCLISVSAGSSHYSVGGYALDEHDKNKGYRPCSEKSIAFIRKLLDVVGVYYWEELKGKHMRVIRNGRGCEVGAIGIQHITEDKKLIFRDFWEGGDQ